MGKNKLNNNEMPILTHLVGKDKKDWWSSVGEGVGKESLSNTTRESVNEYILLRGQFGCISNKILNAFFNPAIPLLEY